jgi:hypothetical protein
MGAPLQAIDPLTEQPHDGDQPVQRLSDRYGLRLCARDLMEIFEIGAARFYELENAKRFQRFELKPVIGRKAWSREAVQRYLDRVGEFAPER